MLATTGFIPGRVCRRQRLFDELPPVGGVSLDAAIRCSQDAPSSRVKTSLVQQPHRQQRKRARVSRKYRSKPIIVHEGSLRADRLQSRDRAPSRFDSHQREASAAAARHTYADGTRTDHIEFPAAKCRSPKHFGVSFKESHGIEKQNSVAIAVGSDMS